jgi:superfamily II DNA/RNA helicase
MTVSSPWSFLPPAYRRAVAHLGFASPTPVQAAALPRALAGESFRAVAPTGTGKTLVYLLAAWRLRESGRATALVLVPTRELGYQVSQMLQELDPAQREGTVVAVGGHGKRGQEKQADRGWRMLVATPGRLLDLLQSGSLSLRALGLVVLDEFDKLIGMGFEEQIAAVLKQVPKGAQRLLLSATDHEVGAAEKLGLGDLPLLSAEREAGARAFTEEFYFLRTAKKKQPLLLEALARTKGQAIVFVGNRDKVNHLHGLLKLRGIRALALHGHMPQKERARAYQEFKEGKYPVLVATDLASRGLDLPETDLIVNYDLPKHYKDYVHRMGRASRRGQPGRCVSFAGPDDYLPMRNLEKESPEPLNFHPDYAQRDAWFAQAKRIHDAEVKRESRREFIREQQGLGEEAG